MKNDEPARGDLEDLYELAADVIDGTASESRRAELEGRLRADPEARRAYLRYALLHAELSLTDAAQMARAAEADRADPPAPVAGPGPRAGWSARPRRWLPWTIAASACLVSLLAAGLALGRRPGGMPPRSRSATVAEQDQGGPTGRPRPDVGPATDLAPGDARRVPGGDAVASLVEARNVAWAEGQAPLAVGTRLGPRDIHCASGTIKLVFDAGALVALEGPADLRILSGMRIRAVRGRITARIDGRAKGFAIETPNTLVVDQGTEFGVEVDAAGQTGVVVFEGLVDLSRTELAADQAPIKRLGQGEALRVGQAGSLSRIVAVERRPGDDAWSTGPSTDRDAVIRSVRDNIRGLDSAKYYRIVHRGLDDDVPAYVDRSYEWNGLDPSGLPGFLRGADYVMPFNDDKRTKDLQITIEPARPATLFIFYDNRVEVPAWLAERFTDTGIDIGLDQGSRNNKPWTTDRGPGRSIDLVYSVWRRDVGPDEPFVLGALGGSGWNDRGMYGIAAVRRP